MAGFEVSTEAVAAGLARGQALEAAVAAAKRYVTRAIETAPGIGHGAGPLNHFAPADATYAAVRQR